MANTTIKRTWNQNRMVNIEDLSGMAFQSEIGGHTFEVSGVNDSGAAVSLSGTVTAVFLRADNAAIQISGAVSSGKAVVTLSSDCYTVPGRFLLTIFVTSNSQKVAVYACVGSVTCTTGAAAGSIPPLVTDSIQTGDIDASGDVTVGGVLDVTNRRSVSTLSNQGWYRVLKTADESGTIIDLYIGRAYGANRAETHKISCHIVGGGKTAFIGETSDANELCIDKIRLTAGGGFAYVDIHYNKSLSNEVLVYFNVYGKGQANGTSVSMNLTPVSASPSGETVAAEYTFAANKRPLLSSDIIRVRREYTNKTIDYDNCYMLLDSYSSMGISSQYYCLGFHIIGWSGFSTYSYQIIRSSSGTDFYLASSVAGTFSWFTVEYWFVDLSV